MKFVPRRAELRKIEGRYGDIYLSCRHRAILRASTTRHFSSCFAPGHSSGDQPELYCFHPDIAIVYLPDRSGQFLARAFVRFRDMVSDGRVYLVASKVYGNTLSKEKIIDELSHVAKIYFSDKDLYLPSSGD